jgi:hypothetical protein
MLLPQRAGTVLVLGALFLGLANGCALFDLFSGRPEFSVSGARVALMPFAGPDTWWYGENATAAELHRLAASLLREGGAELCRSEKITRELKDYVADSDPPWLAYGQRLRADYVIVAHLRSWQIDRPTAVGYAPGSASMDLQVYDVAAGRLTLEKRFEVSVGIDPASTDIFTDRQSTRRALIRLLAAEWRRIFVGGRGLS